MKCILWCSNLFQAEQELKEELERIRNLKIQEDVEREYRRKERDAAIRRNKEMKHLHEARVQQVSDNDQRSVLSTALSVMVQTRQLDNTLCASLIIEVPCVVVPCVRFQRHRIYFQYGNCLLKKWKLYPHQYIKLLALND